VRAWTGRHSAKKRKIDVPAKLRDIRLVAELPSPQPLFAVVPNVIRLSFLIESLPHAEWLGQNIDRGLNMVEDMEIMQEPTKPDTEISATLGTILIIEDDPRMQKVLRRIFVEEHYSVLVAGDGQTGLELFRTEHPLAVVLDLILPKMSGRELCQAFKRLANETPIIVLSAISEVVDKVLLLELGADDYVTKPFSPRELTARVQAAIRRQRKPTRATIFRFADCEIDFKSMNARRNGVPVMLTAHEYKLLKFFTDNVERVLTRELLLNEVWGYNSYPTTRTVDNQILKLRQKLESDPANPKHLLTIYGAGYKFVP
jgi:DNA-binding response OmpR family regulator